MKAYTQEQLASRIVNIRSIENVMSKYAFLTYYKRFDEAVNNFWTQNEPTLTTNDKKIAGYSAVYREIVEKGEEDTRADNEAMRKLFPELADKKDSEIWGVGTAVVHTISTPVIELSEDEKTAKAMFYSMGECTEVDREKGPKAYWVWEKYGADFVWENGEWKFLHIQIGMDIMGNYGDSWAEPKPPMGGGPGGAPGGPAPEQKKPEAPVGKDGKKLKVAPSMGGGMSQPPDGPGKYQVYSRTRVPSEYPRIPEPYTTLEETFSY